MLNKRFLQKISAFIATNKLLEHDERYLVALSGGADSVFLTLVLKELGYDIEAAHCNFHLRGEESNRDECFCRKFCEENGIKLHVSHFDTYGFAKLRKMSIEMAARHLRYSYFNQLVVNIGASATCVAHHQDDSVETVLLNLIRGTGIHGLTGIKPKNGKIVRPLLCVTRFDVEAALNEIKQSYVTDSTNLINDVVRNKIRLNILPLMKEINPSVSDSIATTALRVSEAANALDVIVKDVSETAVEYFSDGSTRINAERLSACPASEYVLFNLLKDYTFNSAQIELIHSVMCSKTGRVFTSPTHRLLTDRSYLFVEPLTDKKLRSLAVPETGLYVYDNKTKFKFECFDRTPDFKISKDKRSCFADMSKVKFPLTIKPAATGDRFIPFGMKGSKLVSDYLTDLKVNLFDKRRQLVVADAEGKIIWLVNQRPDNRCRIMDSTTKILRITCQKS